MYSLLSRILESLEIIKQRLKLLDDKHSALIEAEKRAILECYNQQVYIGSYDLGLLIREAAERSNQRLASRLGPLAKRPPPLDMAAVPIVLTRTDQLTPIKKRSLSENSMRAISKDNFRMTPNLLEMLTARKLKTGDKKK